MWCEQPGFVLHRRPYRETSLLVSLLTPEQGRVDAVVKGVRAGSKAAVQKNAWLQPFRRLSLRWREKPGLVSLNQFEADGMVANLVGPASACGFYLNELLMRALPQGMAAPGLFEQYEATLKLLGSHAEPAAQGWLLRQFELALLEALGAALHLPSPFDLRQRYRWQPDAGLQPAVQGIEGHCLEALLSGRFEPGCLGQQKRLLRSVLAEWLGPQPLKSAQLLKPFFTGKKRT